MTFYVGISFQMDLRTIFYTAPFCSPV